MVYWRSVKSDAPELARYTGQEIFMIITTEENFQKQLLEEMVRVCKKSDGYGIIVDIYSRDHRKIGDKRLPAHAHLF